MPRTQINRLIEILSIPTFFNQEHDLLRYLIKYLKTTDYTFTVDITGNLYITKGVADIYPCVCAHTDSVHENDDITICEIALKDSTRLIGKTSNGEQCGIGADDKAGVFICMELLEILPAVKVALFASEEFGCIGSQNSDPDFFKNVGYVIEFDCPSFNSVSLYSNGVQLFDKQADFYQTIKPILTEHMGAEPILCHHPYTDVWALKCQYLFSCINISTGYYKYHQDNEYVVVDQVIKAITMGKLCIEALGNKFYELVPSIREAKQYPISARSIAAAAAGAFDLHPSRYKDIINEL